MIIFEEGQAKALSRSGALCMKSVHIADDVNFCDFIAMDCDTTEGVINITKGESLPTPKEYTFICNEIGLFGSDADFLSTLEIIFCDTEMVVTLQKGAIAVKNKELASDSGICIASVNVPDDDVPSSALSDITWLSMENLLALCSRLSDYGLEYPQDYIYVVEVKGGKVSSRFKSVSTRMDTKSVKLAPNGAIDISFGALAGLISIRLSKERERLAMRQLKEMRSKPRNDFEDDEFSSYVEDEEDEIEEEEDSEIYL